MRQPCFLPPLRAKLVWWGILQKQKDVECEHLLLGDENLFLSYLTGNGCSPGEWSSEMIGKEARRGVDSTFPTLGEDSVSGSFFV